MTRLRTNIIANLSGQGLVTAVQLVTIPLYIHWLGIEAYGLIGFQLTLQTLAQAFDLGLSLTINRQLAQYSAMPNTAQESRDFVRTLELIYWLIGAVLGLVLFLAAPYIAARWLGQSKLPTVSIEHALRLMAVLITVQWPLTLYEGGLLGLQRNVILNVVRVSMMLASSVGGYLVIRHVSTTAAALFTWQIVVGVTHVLTLALLLWARLPAASRPPHPRAATLSGVWRFAAGMTAISAIGVLLTQLDKVILSRILSLEYFGYYVLASVVGNGLLTLVRPVFTSLFPRFSALVALGDVAALRRVYVQAWQLIAVLIVPLAACVALFSFEVILAWTGDQTVARYAGPIASLLLIGSVLNAFMHVPYALQLAYGWTKAGLVSSSLLAICTVPLVIFLANNYGGVGAAFAWPALNLVYAAAIVPITHRRYREVTGTAWLGREVIVPVIGGVVAVVMWRLLLPGLTGRFLVAAALVSVWLTAEIALIASSRSLREHVRRYAGMTASYVNDRAGRSRTRA